MGFYYMFHGGACHISTADDWLALSFKVGFIVDLMVFISDYKEIPNPKFFAPTVINFLLEFYLHSLPTDDI
jgi:hypothetical protein